MAFKDNSIQWQSEYGGKVLGDGFYNVDQAVGGPEVGTSMPAANMITDLQLVYYFSFIIYRDGDKNIFPNKGGERFDVTPPMLDYHSQHTKQQVSSIIWRFQTDLIKRGKPVYRDGRCDKATGEASTISRSPYTIVMYNFYYEHTARIAYGVTKWQDYLLTDPLLPEQARWELRFRQFPYTYM